MAEILVEKLGVPALYLANKVGLTIIWWWWGQMMVICMMTMVMINMIDY